MTKPAASSWREIREDVLRRVRSGVWPPGAQIPYEEDLAEEFGCGRGAVNRALQELAAEGVLERKRKAGTRVTAHPVARPRLEIPILRHEVEARGGIYGHLLLSRALEPAPAAVRGRMGLKAPKELLRLATLHLSDSAPYAHEERWIDPEAAPGALQADFAALSANEWLLRHAPYDFGEMSISAESASLDLAEILRISAGAPLLLAERVTWRRLGDAEIAVTFARQSHPPGHKMRAAL